MYLTPKPMRPDTFSQYGYADAENLRALRRGYGHDIYPQYPTTYNMPRVIAGLGAFTHKGYTVDYYASSTNFADKNLKRLYEGMRNADIEFQKNAANFLKVIAPVLGLVEVVTAGNVKADDLKKALRLKLPTWGVALFLEVAAGKRPFDNGFKASMKEAAKDVRQAKSLFAVIAGVSTTLAAAAAAGTLTGFLAPLAAAVAPAAAVAASTGGAAALAAILEPIFDTLGKGKPLSKKQMKDMLEGAAKLTGQKAPSSAEIDLLTSNFDNVTKGKPVAGNAASAAAAAEGAQKVEPQRQGQKELPPPPPPEATPQGRFPVVPVVVGVVGLVGVALILKSRK